MGPVIDRSPSGVAGAASLALIAWGLTVAAKPAAAANDDDWTVPAIIVGVMMFIFIYNVMFGTGKNSSGSCGGGGDSSDGCGGGCGGGD
jgi:hypothetical protein